MPCAALKLEDGRTAILCSRGKRTRKCHCCGAPAARLCDFELRRGKSCDKPLCDACAVPAGDDRDYCPDHPWTAVAQPQLSLVL
jgi:hypothetical protein